MTGLTRSSFDLDARRKRMIFRAWRRGTREMDLLMGRYVEGCVAQFSEADLDEVERLMDVPCLELYAWVTEASDVPVNYDNHIFRALRDYHLTGAGRAAEA